MTNHQDKELSSDRIEIVAQAIYAAFEYEGSGSKPSWYAGGNSQKQDEARRYARAALAASPQLPVAEQPAGQVVGAWRDMTDYGQVKVGDFISFFIGDEHFDERVKVVLNAGTDREELIYNKKKNYYVISKNVLTGFGNVKGFRFFSNNAAAPHSPVAQPEPLHITHAPLIREAVSLLRLRQPVAPDFERVASELQSALDGCPTPAGTPSAEWLEVAEKAIDANAPVAQMSSEPFCVDCGDQIMAHNPGTCGTCHSIKYENASHPSNAAVQRPTDDELWDQTLRDRDNYQEWADRLAYAIAVKTNVDIGEHSNLNNPWQEALDAIENYEPSAATVQPVVQAPTDCECNEGERRVCAFRSDEARHSLCKNEAAPAAIDVRDAALEEVIADIRDHANIFRGGDSHAVRVVHGALLTQIDRIRALQSPPQTGKESNQLGEQK